MNVLLLVINLGVIYLKKLGNIGNFILYFSLREKFLNVKFIGFNFFIGYICYKV